MTEVVEAPVRRVGVLRVLWVVVTASGAAVAAALVGAVHIALLLLRVAAEERGTSWEDPRVTIVYAVVLLGSVLVYGAAVHALARASTTVTGAWRVTTGVAVALFVLGAWSTLQA